MPVRRNSPAVVLYVAVAIAQLAAVAIIGGGGVSIPGVLLGLLLFGLLYLGQPVAWWILMILDTVGLCALVVTTVSDLVSARHVLWLNVLVLFGTSLAMEIVLLSGGMRRHVASRGMRLAPRGGPTVRQRWSASVGRRRA